MYVCVCGNLSFDELIAVVGKIGQQEAAARDLETKIDQVRVG